jgi:hypothetical protein
MAIHTGTVLLFGEQSGILKLKFPRTIAGQVESDSICPTDRAQTIAHDGWNWVDHGPPSEISEWRIFMLEDYYVKPSTIDRIRVSWLAPKIESYLEWLQAHGYSRLVVYRRLPPLFRFAEFAQKKGCRDIASCKAYIKEFVSHWLAQHGAKAKTTVAVRKRAIDADCGVRQMLQLACNGPDREAKPHGRRA